MQGMAAARREQRVGRYAIQGEIAVGGMATVHYGRLLGTAGFSRGVAIKRLHRQFAKDPDFVGMFLDEARLASRIQHPNVVPILDVVAEQGELFLVMDFVAGESLSKLVRAAREGVPIPIAIAIGVGILEGLHAAHDAKSEDGAPLHIVHRDVSPQNVLVGTDGIAHLIDFGVAKAAGNTTMTREGQVKGKIAYMAPEQIRSQAIDRRADVYAASVVIWEMLTGKRFLGAADSDAALVLRALNSKPSPPSAERPSLPKGLDDVLLRGLRHRADERWSTTREMAKALELVVAPAPTREVSKWVDEMAGVSVRDRTHQMAAFDASVATELPGRPSIADEPSEDTAALAPASAAAETSAPGAAAAGSEEASRTAPSGGLSRRVLGLAIVALLIAGTVGFYLARLVPSEGTAAPVANESKTERPPPEPPSPAADPTSPAAEPASEIEATTPPIAATPEPADTPVINAPPLKKPPPTGKLPPPSTKAPKAGCNPPYVIRPDGLREYKAECLQ